MEEIIELSWKTPMPKEWIEKDGFLRRGKWRLNLNGNVYIHYWCNELKDWRYHGVVGTIEAAKNYCEESM